MTLQPRQAMTTTAELEGGSTRPLVSGLRTLAAVVLTLAFAVTLAACGGGNGGSDNAPATQPGGTAPPDSGGGAGSGGSAVGGTGTATLSLNRSGQAQYIFMRTEADSTPGNCGVVMGGFLVQMFLRTVNGAPPEDEGNTISISLPPDGIDDEASIEIQLPGGERLSAGGEGEPPVSLTRNGDLEAGGTQQFSSSSGEDVVGVVLVSCD